MNPLQQKIEKAIRGNKNITPVDSFEEITFWLAKELHLSPEELLGYPTPYVFGLYDKLHKFFKDKNKAMKKK